MKHGIAILIPTYNAGEKWEQVLQSILVQTEKIEKLCIIDSGSTDNTVEIAKIYGAEVMNIPKREFSHGYARHKLISKHPEIDIYIFLTQDAILASHDSIRNMVEVFKDPLIGAAYGRQLPHLKARLLESHNRLFNYPVYSSVKSKEDINQYGFKTIFCSNSFAAYKKDAYYQAGGFPLNANFGEDSLLFAKMILKGWKTAYLAEATVYHSHHLTVKQEFLRYIEIGKFHQQNPWLYEEFGKPGKEGLKYTLSEIKFCIKRNPLLIFTVFIKCLNKYLGYKIGFMAKQANVRQSISIKKHFETA